MRLEDIPQRLQSRLLVNEECWFWQGTITDKGYGQVWWDGKVRSVHRLVWEMTNGAIPSGEQAHHKCENKACANSEHLEMLTQKEHRRLHRTCEHGDHLRYIRGRESHCRECTRQRLKKRRENDPAYRERRREYFRRWRAKTAGVS